MYSYEDRIRAVKLYIKLGKRLRLTIRQVGYPTKTSLIGRCREYGQSRDLQVSYARSMQKYSAEQMQVAVQHYLDHDRCIASTMMKLGCPRWEVLTGWIDELHPEVRQRIVGRAVPSAPGSPGRLRPPCPQRNAALRLDPVAVRCTLRRYPWHAATAHSKS